MFTPRCCPEFEPLGICWAYGKSHAADAIMLGRTLTMTRDDLRKGFHYVQGLETWARFVSGQLRSIFEARGNGGGRMGLRGQ